MDSRIRYTRMCVYTHRSFDPTMERRVNNHGTRNRYLRDDQQERTYTTRHDEGYNEGYTAGTDDGYGEGYKNGVEEGL